MKISQELQAAKFICLGSFTIVQIFFFIFKNNLYLNRLPTNVDENREWTIAINKVNDEKHKCKGKGWICSLHFDVKNIKNKCGRIQLEKGAIPVNFECSNSLTVNENETDANQNTIDLDVLNFEIQDLKRLLFEERMSRDIEIQKKNDHINALTKKCNDLTMRIKCLERACATLDVQGKKSRDQLLQYMGATDNNVNSCNIFIFMSFYYLFVRLFAFFVRRTFAKEIS